MDATNREDFAAWCKAFRPAGLTGETLRNCQKLAYAGEAIVRRVPGNDYVYEALAYNADRPSGAAWAVSKFKTKKECDAAFRGAIGGGMSAHDLLRPHLFGAGTAIYRIRKLYPVLEKPAVWSLWVKGGPRNLDWCKDQEMTTTALRDEAIAAVARNPLAIEEFGNYARELGAKGDTGFQPVPATGENNTTGRMPVSLAPGDFIVFQMEGQPEERHGVLLETQDLGWLVKHGADEVFVPKLNGFVRPSPRASGAAPVAPENGSIGPLAEGCGEPASAGAPASGTAVVKHVALEPVLQDLWSLPLPEDKTALEQRMAADQQIRGLGLLDIGRCLAHARDTHFQNRGKGFETWGRPRTGLERRLFYMTTRAGWVANLFPDLIRASGTNDVNKLDLIGSIGDVQQIRGFLERVNIGTLSRDALRKKVQLWQRNPDLVLPEELAPPNAAAAAHARDPMAAIMRSIQAVAAIGSDDAAIGRLAATCDPITLARAGFGALNVSLAAFRREDARPTEVQVSTMQRLYEDLGKALEKLEA